MARPRTGMQFSPLRFRGLSPRAFEGRQKSSWAAKGSLGASRRPDISCRTRENATNRLIGRHRGALYVAQSTHLSQIGSLFEKKCRPIAVFVAFPRFGLERPRALARRPAPLPPVLPARLRLSASPPPAPLRGFPRLPAASVRSSPLVLPQLPPAPRPRLLLAVCVLLPLR